MSYKSGLTLGLYSAFLARNAIVFKSNLHPKLTVDTMFLGKRAGIKGLYILSEHTELYEYYT